MLYTTVPLDQVNNPNCKFVKLVDEDGICQFDTFVEEVEKNAMDKKALSAIFASMDSYHPSLLLPKEKFRQIKWKERSDIYEFKKKNIRVYVILQKPDVYVIMGGYKNNQENDIAKIKRDIVNFKR